MIWLLVFSGADLNMLGFDDGRQVTVWEMCNEETYKALLHFWDASSHKKHPKVVRDAIVW
jgi:hypothetical protein